MGSRSLKFSPFCMPRPPEMTTRAAVSSGRSLFESSAETKREISGIAATSIFSMTAVPPSEGAGSKLAARTVRTFFASLDFTVAMAFAGVDGADEGVGVDDFGDVADGLQVQESCDAGHDVLAGCGAGGEEVVVVAGHGDEEGGEGLGEGVGEGRAVGDVDLGDALDLGGGGGGGVGAVAGDEDVGPRRAWRRRRRRCGRAA